MGTQARAFHENQVSGVLPEPPSQYADSYDMSPGTRRIVYLFLLGGVLFLASVAAYVWYGFYQWKSIP